MSFRTKLDYSDNRQIRQSEKSSTILSGGTVFGVPFSALTSGPDLSTKYQISQYVGFVSDFSGNNTTTIFNWTTPVDVSIVDSSISPIIPSNSGLTQSVDLLFQPSSSTNIDGNIVNLSYSGIELDNLYVTSMVEVSPGSYTGQVSSDFYIFTAGTLDFTGRTIWVDNTEILRTDRLIVSRNAQPGYVLAAINSEGMCDWVPSSTGGTGSTLYEVGSGVNSTQRIGVGNQANADFSASLGGSNNVVSGPYAFIGGGSGNTNSLGAVYGFIGGGLGNYIGDEFASILGGENNSATGKNSSVINGVNNLALDDASIVINGSGNTSSGVGSIVGGANNEANNALAISFGLGNTSSGTGSFTHGGLVSYAGYIEVDVTSPDSNSATNIGSFCIGGGNVASGINSFVSGSRNISFGLNSSAEGERTEANGQASHAEGGDTIASLYASHAEGRQTTASGLWSHSQNRLTEALGQGSHSGGEGFSSTSKVVSSGRASFTHFRVTSAIGDRGAYGLDSAILGGVNHNIDYGANNSIILGGENNIIDSGTTNSIVLGGASIVCSVSNTVYVPDLIIEGLVSQDPIATDANGKIVAGTSDFRLKKNIQKIFNGLDVVKNLRGVSYEYTDESNMGPGLRYGFIAQEVQEVIPEIVKLRAKGDGMLSLSYTEIIPWLVEAVKELASPSYKQSEIIIESESIKAEDNNIELNYNGTKESSVGGGITVVKGWSDDKDIYFKLNEDKHWTTNTYISPYGLIIPNYTPSNSDDALGVFGEITRDDNYIYIKTSAGWKRTSLESF